MGEIQIMWGWQPALYLFLGGMGAGAFVMAAILEWRYGARLRKAVALSMWASIACLAVGLLCLLTELTAPLRGLMLWQSFSNFGSWMTIGAWILVAAMVVFGVSALLATEATAKILGRIIRPLEGGREKALRVCSAVGLMLGVGVAAYTGILLMSAHGIPMWDSALLPFVFTASALDTGVALVEIIVWACARREALAPKAMRFIEICVVVLVAVEALCLAGLLATLTAGGTATPAAEAGSMSAGLLLSGGFAGWFWGLVVFCGLMVPFAVAVAGLVRHKSDKGAVEDAEAADGASGSESPSRKRATVGGSVLFGAFGALAGGCALRFLVVYSGIHADPMAQTVELMFQDLIGRLG